MLIWRGMGIAVPIIFFLTGLIVKWVSGDPDTRIGNPNFIGWTSLFSGIVILLLGLALLGSSEDENGNKVKKKHDFFWIPVFVWGLLLGVLSIYLLVIKGKGASNEPTSVISYDSTATAPEKVPTTRIVNFFNPTNDTLGFVIADDTKEGLIENGKVAPHSFEARELEKGTYMFVGFDTKGGNTLTLPDREFAGDEKKYRMHEDEKGSFYQRIVNAATKQTDDYDEAWLSLDGKSHLLVVNVTTACDPEVTEAAVKSADWAGSIQEENDARDMMEPLFMQFLPDETIKVVAPGEKLPTEIAENEVIYLLVPYAGKGDKNAVIAKAVLAARF
ncbi:MAG: hypothetical protein IPN95_22875 [Bacteroidetes bacterium]|nr:hypothetical protein [Bacteroidota bacterium]